VIGAVVLAQRNRADDAALRPGPAATAEPDDADGVAAPVEVDQPNTGAP